MAETYRLYKITDPQLTHIGDVLLTTADRLNGVLLRPSEAKFYLAHNQIRPFNGNDTAVIPPRPLNPKKLSEIFAPALAPDASGQDYILRSVDGQLVLVEYQEPVFIPPDEPDEPGEIGDIGDVATFFRYQLM